MARDDKANVGHRHTTSDIRGGRFPERMLPSTIIPAIEAAQATAASKSKVVFSTLAASGTDFSEGDTWYRRAGGIIIAQWEFTSGAWAGRTLDSAVVANLDASKITTGTLSAGTTITAGDPAGSRIELDSAGLRKYATDGMTVQVDLTGDVAAFSGLITGSEIIAGTAGAARLEMDADGLRQYAADGTTVLLDTADAATIRARSGNSTALGANAQKALTTGTSDTAVGSLAQRFLTTGYQDTAVGSLAQNALTIGNGNTAVGNQAQYLLDAGNQNTAVGILAQYLLTTGNQNTAVGDRAQSHPGGISANATKTASFQTSVGPMSGQSSATQVDGITTVGYLATAGAANATSIGREARADHAGSIALGYQALTTQVDQVMVGPRDVEITSATKGLVLVSPDTTRMRITVADDGSLLINGTAIGGGPAASETAAGIVELATSAEAVTGTDTVRAVTPAGVAAVLAITKTDMAFAAGWDNYDAAETNYAHCRWYKDAFGLVHLEGLFKRTGATITPAAPSGVIFTLPAAAWPAKTISIVCSVNGGFGRVNISPDGTVAVPIAFVWTSGSSYAYLDGINFAAA